MQPAQPGPAKDDHHCYDTALNVSAAKLNVYRHERLAYTEAPRKNPAARALFSRATATLKAALFKALNRFHAKAGCLGD